MYERQQAQSMDEQAVKWRSRFGEPITAPHTVETTQGNSIQNSIGPTISAELVPIESEANSMPIPADR